MSNVHVLGQLRHAALTIANLSGPKLQRVTLIIVTQKPRVTEQPPSCISATKTTGRQLEALTWKWHTHSQFRGLALPTTRLKRDPATCLGNRKPGLLGGQCHTAATLTERLRSTDSVLSTVQALSVWSLICSSQENYRRDVQSWPLCRKPKPEGLFTKVAAARQKSWTQARTAARRPPA